MIFDDDSGHPRTSNDWLQNDCTNQLIRPNIRRHGHTTPSLFCYVYSVYRRLPFCTLSCNSLQAFQPKTVVPELQSMMPDSGCVIASCYIFCYNIRHRSIQPFGVKLDECCKSVEIFVVDWRKASEDDDIVLSSAMILCIIIVV